MFSVENFYYVLYNNLLKPCNIQAGLFSPFGSTDPADLRYSHLESNGHNVGHMEMYKQCLFWDQEPLFTKSFDSVALSPSHYAKFFSHYHCKILANSEYSDIKNKICKEYKFLDFYYFYHGFAALDWFRDYRYLNKTNTFDKVFITLNRLCTKERSYRLTLVSLLSEKKLLDHGHVSLHYTSKPNRSLKEELFASDCLISKESKKLIYKELFVRNENFIADFEEVKGYASAGFDHKLLTSALWHIVTETIFYHKKIHLTEKIFKPIVNFRPFILVASPGNLQYLRDYGFKTFDKWIDESYDVEQDPDKRLKKITKEIEKLCDLSEQRLNQMFDEMQDVLEHNFNHFYGDFKNIISRELIDNFESCLLQWNNGRVNHQFDLSEFNFDKIKQRISA